MNIGAEWFVCVPATYCHCHLSEDSLWDGTLDSLL